MPGAPVWAMFFSGMLFSLDLTSTLRNTESVVTPPLDLKAMPRWVPKEALTGEWTARPPCRACPHCPAASTLCPLCPMSMRARGP